MTNWRKIIQFWFYRCIFNCEQQSNTVHMIYQHLLTLKLLFFLFFLTNLMSGVIWQLNINVIISVRISINVCKVSFIKKIDIAFSENQLRLAASMWYLDANGISSSDKSILWWSSYCCSSGIWFLIVLAHSPRISSEHVIAAAILRQHISNTDWFLIVNLIHVPPIDVIFFFKFVHAQCWFFELSCFCRGSCYIEKKPSSLRAFVEHL